MKTPVHQFVLPLLCCFSHCTLWTMCSTPFLCTFVINFQLSSKHFLKELITTPFVKHTVQVSCITFEMCNSDADIWLSNNNTDAVFFCLVHSSHLVIQRRSFMLLCPFLYGLWKKTRELKNGETSCSSILKLITFCYFSLTCPWHIWSFESHFEVNRLLLKCYLLN